MLDSSWELAVAEYLDNNQIIWERPKQPIPYCVNGKNKKYYPDFFLPEYNLYLDPKNPYRLQVDRQKIEQVSKTIVLIVGDVNYVLAQLKLKIGTA